MSLPDTRDLVPSAACKALTDYFGECLARDPAYCYADALAEMPADIDGYAWMILFDCWNDAAIVYAQTHGSLP